MLGREVATLVNENLLPGTYEVTFNAVHLAAGVSYYRLTVGTSSDTKKFILLR